MKTAKDFGKIIEKTFRDNETYFEEIDSFFKNFSISTKFSRHVLITNEGEGKDFDPKFSFKLKGERSFDCLMLHSAIGLSSYPGHRWSNIQFDYKGKFYHLYYIKDGKVPSMESIKKIEKDIYSLIDFRDKEEKDSLASFKIQQTFALLTANIPFYEYLKSKESPYPNQEDEKIPNFPPEWLPKEFDWEQKTVVPESSPLNQVAPSTVFSQRPIEETFQKAYLFDLLKKEAKGNVLDPLEKAILEKLKKEW
jgi:hypothetical protein